MPATARPFEVSIVELNPDGSVAKVTCIGKGDEVPTMPPAELFDGARGGPDVIQRMMGHQHQVMEAAAAEAAANKPIE